MKPIRGELETTAAGGVKQISGKPLLRWLVVLLVCATTMGLVGALATSYIVTIRRDLPLP